MNSEQARLVQAAAATDALYLSGDSKGMNVSLEQLTADEPRGPDAFSYLAIVASETWALFAGQRPDAIWDQLRPPVPEFAALAKRDAAVAASKALRDGTGAELPAIDRGIALLSTLDLSLAAIETLAERSGTSAAEWCQRFALGVAGGHGVDSDE